MKKLLLCQMISILGLNAFGQDFSLVFYATNANGLHDSVTIGFNSSSTVGIDTALGEKDITGHPAGNLLFRVIQRDSQHFNCHYRHFSQSGGFEAFAFSDNFDSKVNFRPDPLIGSFDDSLNSIFELKVSSDSFPVKIGANLKELRISRYDSWSAIYLLDSNCVPVTQNHLASWRDNDSLVAVTDSSQTILIKFDIHIGIDEKKEELEIYPNPAVNVLNFNESLAGRYLIYDLSGKVKMSGLLNASSLNIANLNDGGYYIELIQEERVLRTIFLKSGQ